MRISKLLFSVFLAVLAMVTIAQAEIVSDSFTRSDGGTANDSIGDAESPASTYHWSEGYLVGDYAGDAGAIVSGKVQLHSSGGSRQITLNTNSADIIAAADVTFVLGEGAGPAANAMMFLRRNSVLGGQYFWTENGTAYVEFSPSGLLTVKEVVGGSLVTLYNQNPWTSSTSDTYGAAGSLPATVNGLDFDVDQDGRIGAGVSSLETIILGADLQGTALSVSINGQVFYSGTVTGTTSATGNNYFSLAYNTLSGTGSVVTNFDDVNLNLIPEPVTLAFLAAGSIFMAFSRKRK